MSKNIGYVKGMWDNIGKYVYTVMNNKLTRVRIDAVRWERHANRGSDRHGHLMDAVEIYLIGGVWCNREDIYFSLEEIEQRLEKGGKVRK